MIICIGCQIIKYFFNKNKHIIHSIILYTTEGLIGRTKSDCCLILRLNYKIQSAVCLAIHLLSIPTCPRREGSVLPLAGLRYPMDIFLGNQGTASPFCLPSSVSGTDLTFGFASAGLSGNFPARPRLPDEHALRNRKPYQRQFGGTSGGRHTQHIRNLWRPSHWLEGRMGERPIQFLEFGGPCLW